MVTTKFQFNKSVTRVAPLPSILSRELEQFLDCWILGTVANMGSAFANDTSFLVAANTSAHIISDELWRYERGAAVLVTVGPVGRVHL